MLLPRRHAPELEPEFVAALGVGAVVANEPRRGPNPGDEGGAPSNEVVDPRPLPLMVLAAGSPLSTDDALRDNGALKSEEDGRRSTAPKSPRDRQEVERSAPRDPRRSIGACTCWLYEVGFGDAGAVPSSPGGGPAAAMMFPIEPAREARRRGVVGDDDGDDSGGASNSTEPRRSAFPSKPAEMLEGSARCNARITWSLIWSNSGANASNHC